MSLFVELKRRNVFRVGIAYVLMTWVVLQAGDFALDLIDAPNWVIQALFIVAVIGLPVALFFAWAFEVTPEGIKRDHEVDRSQSIAPTTGRKLDRAIIAFLALAVVLLLGDRFFFSADRAPSSTTQQQTGTTAGENGAQTRNKSIAVLPFADLSQAQDQEWFADGLAEEILNALAKTPDIMVASRTSSFQYRNSDQDIATIAANLGVAHVLEGSVRSSGDRIRVTAQLIRASDGFHLWSENYDRDVSDIITIQEDLARNIAVALKTSMDPAALEAMANVGTRSIEAYQAYLQGLRSQAIALTQAESSSDFRQAYEKFEQARVLDPTFAKAHVNAADYWKVELTPNRTDTGTSGYTPLEALREYQERIGLAIQHAKSEADRLRSLADRATLDLRLREARRLFERYLELRPNDEQARFEYANILLLLDERSDVEPLLNHWAALGGTSEYAANAYINTAYRVIDPSIAADKGLEWLQRYSTSSGMAYQTHRTLVWAGRFDEAKQLAAQYATLTTDGNSLLDARQACANGDREAAEAALARLQENPQANLSSIWHVHDMLGNKQAAADTLRPLESTGVLFQLASFLTYGKFDPTPYPEIMALLERESIQRPPALDVPFKCPPPSQPSIAVLPFRDMSPAQDQGWFGEGIAEELLNGLVKLEGIKVASRTSTFSMADEGLDIPTLAQRLSVGHVLEGSIRSAGNQVRVTAQLIDVSDDKHLWSETFDGTLDDIFQIQDTITAQILAELEVQLTGSKPTSAAEELTSSPEAYRKYLLGRQQWRQRSVASLKQSIELFNDAVALDPEFHRAWSNMALAYANLGAYDVNTSNTQAQADAKEAAERALSINPDSSEALAMMASLTMESCNLLEGAQLYQQAMRANDWDPTPRHWFAIDLVRFGLLNEARDLIREASRIDPLISAVIGIEGLVEMTSGNYRRAGQLFQESANLGLYNGDPYLENLSRLMAGDDLPADALTGEASRAYPEAARAFVAYKTGNGSIQELEQASAALATLDGQDAWFAAELLALAGSSKALDLLSDVGGCDDTPPTVWSEPFRSLRGTPEFFHLMEDFGIVDFWRGYGWPDNCASLDQSLAECPAP